MTHIFFDLDGTLTNSSVGIYNALYYAFDKMNMVPPDDETMRKFIGPPLLVSFKEYMNMDDTQAVESLRLYREYYTVKGIYENEPYENVPEMLEMLRERKIKIALCSTKPQFMCEMVLKHFNLYDYFSCVCGAITERQTKQETIQRAIDFFGITETQKKDVYMVGDRKFDILGATQCNIKSIGALYGFPEENELENAGADFLVKNVKELMELIDKCI